MTTIEFDDFGNELVRDNISYYLRLKSEDSDRLLGKMIFLNGKDILVCERNARRHFFRSTKSWGFCEGLVRTIIESYPNPYVGVKSDVGKYLIKATDILLTGEYLHFKTQGFERQIFVRYDKFVCSNVPTEFMEKLCTLTT